MSDNTQLVANVPAHIMARIAARQGAKSALLDAVVSGEQYPKISIRASRFRLIDGDVETVVGTELDVIFVAVNPKVSKVWYDKPYTADTADKTPPKCWADNGVNPNADVETPFHTDCASCPNNVVGSKITPAGKQTTICNSIRHTACVPSADPTKVYGLTIPVSAMKAFRLYFKELSQFGLVPEEVVSTLGFDDDASFPKITFKHKGYVPEKHLATIESMGTSDEAKQVIRISAFNAPRLAAPAAQAAIAAPAPAPAPAPVETPKVAPPPEDKPVPVAAAAAPKPPKAVKTESKPETVAKPDDAVNALEKQLDDLFGS